MYFSKLRHMDFFVINISVWVYFQEKAFQWIQIFFRCLSSTFINFTVVVTLTWYGLNLHYMLVSEIDLFFTQF